MPTYPYMPSRNDADEQVALFIDWDNLVISNYSDRGTNRPNLDVIMQKAQQYGTLVIARAYAEWTNTVDRLEVYKAGVETVYAPVFHADRDLSGQTGRGKSLADPVMVTDCIDFLHLLPSVRTYVLVTGDKDMMPVVRLAKMRGRRVVVIGPDYVANVLQQICDEFVPYRLLLAQAAGPMDPYAAYYQQAGYGQPMPGVYYPPVQPAPQNQPSNNNARNAGSGNRRLTNGRRNTSTGPQIPSYNQAPVPPANTYGYYGYNNQPQYQPPVPGAGYPYQPQQPGVTPPIPQAQGYVQPVQPQQYQQPAPQQYQPQPQQYQQPAPQPQQYQPAVPAPVVATPAVVQPQQAAQPQPQQPAARPANQSNSAHSSNFEEIKEIIRNILNQRSSTNARSQMRARDLKEDLLRRIPTFNERRYGFSKFKAMLTALEAAGILQMDQIGHILWVSLPGTPRAESSEGMYDENEMAAIPGDNNPDMEDDDDIDENAEGGEEALEAAVESDSDEEQEQETAPDTEETYAEPVANEAIEVRPEIKAEERTTTLVEAPIGAHTQRNRPQPAQVQAGAQKVNLGPKPTLLEQPHYQEIIIMIEGLRHRNKWLGYELLLSNVRDHLTKNGMGENEAKSHAGTMLSRMLSEGVLKMAVEVHSRGARKMRVQVSHLQMEHKAVKYALGAKAAEESAAEQVAAEEQATALESMPEELAAAPMVEVAPDTTPTQEISAEPAPQVEDTFGYFGKYSYTGEYTPQEQAEPEPVQEAAPAVEEYTEAPAEGAADTQDAPESNEQPEMSNAEALAEEEAETDTDEASDSDNDEPEVEASEELESALPRPRRRPARVKGEDGEPKTFSRRAPRRRPGIKLPTTLGINPENNGSGEGSN